MSSGIVNLRLSILIQEDIRRFQRYVEVLAVEGSVTRREEGGGGMRRGVKRSEEEVGAGGDVCCECVAVVQCQMSPVSCEFAASQHETPACHPPGTRFMSKSGILGSRCQI